VFREAAVSGGVNPATMRKRMADYWAALQSELSREFRVRSGGSESESLGLSTDALLGRMAPETRAAYDQAMRRFRLFMASGEEENENAVCQGFDDLLERAPRLAAAAYWRGRIEEERDNPREAIRRFDEALGLAPDFPEALCARAAHHMRSGEWKAARERVDRALALQPDLGEARLLLSRLEREDDRSTSAADAASLARALSPTDPDLQARAQMVLNAVRGPIWARPNQHETAHYRVRSDLPPQKCRMYAEHLEAVRATYEEVLALPAPPGRRAEVLLFNSQEGYHSYMDFTAGDRQEHTLGGYSPWHGHLSLFEDAEVEETLRVLYHEGFHQYLHRVLARAPIWFNEGMAEYVGSSRVEQGKVVERGRIQAGRLADLQAAMKYGWRFVPFDRIMVESQASFYGRFAPFKYAQAWSMIQFFIQGADGKRRSMLQAYVRALSAGATAQEAFEVTFGREDLRAIENEWLDHFKLPKPAPPAPPPAPLAAAPVLDASSPSSSVVNLLEIVVPERDSIEGVWALSDRKLVSPENVSWARLQLGYVPPEEYDLRLVATRRSGNDALALGLAVGERQFVVELDGDGATASGLGLVDGKAWNSNETTRRGAVLTQGQPSVILCSVRKKGVTVSVDGKPVISWTGDAGRLAVPPDWRVTSRRRLFLGTYRSMYHITELSVVHAAAPVAAPAPPPEPAPPPLSKAELEALIQTLTKELDSKEEKIRIQAIRRLGDVRDPRARGLLAKRIDSDTLEGRKAAVRAIIRQRHPSVAATLGTALRANRDGLLVPDLLRALGDLDVCASIPVLLASLETDTVNRHTLVLEQIEKIGCPEAGKGLAAWIKRFESESRKDKPDPAKVAAAGALVSTFQRTLQRLAGSKTPPPGKTWTQFVEEGGLFRKLGTVHHCESTNRTFEILDGRSVVCPHVPDKSPHEDSFLKHRWD
jgi:tetratricopeptide (TPR) repeat protein